MIDLKVGFERQNPFEGLDEELSHALREKMVDVGLLLYQKVMQNLDGFVLQKRSGELANSINVHVTTTTNPMEVFVGPEPADAKAWVLEEGGTKAYVIAAVNAKMLHFITKEGNEVFVREVHRQPLRAFRYLALALDEVNVIQEFEEAMEAGLDVVL